MKKIIYIASLIATAFFSACSPNIEVRDLPANLPKTDISVDYTEPNQPILTVNDETVFTANWDFGSGVVLQGKSVKGFFPLEGYQKYTLTAINGAGTTTVVDSVKIEESNPDMVYDIPAYAALVGKKGDGGKYWVYDQAVPGGGDVCYMTANYDWEEFWWNPYNPDEEGPSPDALNEIKFDLEGGFNFSRYETKDILLEKGSFVLNVKSMTIKFVGANIPDYNEANCDPDMTATGEYYIKVLNDYELLLWQDQSQKNPDDFDYGWAWKFKARDVSGTNPLHLLAGTPEEDGKTWVFNQDAPGGKVSYMTASDKDYEPVGEGWLEFWWNPYEGEDDGLLLQDYDNDIKFELDLTYTRFAADGTEIEKGTYEFNTSSMTITLTDAHIPNYNDENLDPAAISDTYEVKLLEEGKLILWQDHGQLGNEGYDYGWAWEFKVKE